MNFSGVASGAQVRRVQPFMPLRSHGNFLTRPNRLLSRSPGSQKWSAKARVCSATAAPGASLPPDQSGMNQQQPLQQLDSQPDVRLSTYHYVAFLVIMGGGLLFVAVLLYFTSDMAFQRAITKVVKRLFKTVGLRQLTTILSAMAFVKYGLEPVIRAVRTATKAQGPWEKSPEYYILKEVYKPLEFLFLVAAVTTMAENFLPQVINIPKGVVQTVVRSTLSLTFVAAAARVVFNIKGRIVRESTWQMELKGDLTRQRRLEALDKLLSLATLVVASIFGVKALGMDVNSVLAIGGVGGVAVGLAGREILENLFTGLIILSSNPFEVGDEVLFRPTSGQVVEGIVVDVGWYRTTIRSFEREIYIIPNSVFSRNVVLNISRKNREWRFYEFLSLRLEDLPKINAVVSDVRKILRQDNRIIQKLHRRVFLDKVTRDHCSVYISFYVEAANRDAFMAIKQDLLLAFIDCVERNGARLARNKLQLEMLPSLSIESMGPYVDIPALPQPVDVAAAPPAGGNGGGGGGSANGGSSGSPSPPLTKQEEVCKDDPAECALDDILSPSASSNGDVSSSSSSTGGSSAPSSSSGGSGGKPVSTSSSSPPPPSAGKPAGGQTTPKGPGPINPTPQAVASALTNTPGAASKIQSAIFPDAIVGGSQDGNTVLGSFDEN